MREFNSTHARAQNLSGPAKVLYTTFSLLTFAGIVGSMVLYHEMVGLPGADGVTAYYNADAAPDPTLPPHEGAGAALDTDGAELDLATPELDLAGPELDLAAPESSRPAIVVAQSPRKLLEVMHFHLFSIPVLLLIAGHLFMLTSISDRAKMLWIGIGSGAVALHVAAPWAVYFWGGVIAWFYPTSGVLLLGSFTVLLLLPVWDMWRRPANGPSVFG